MSELTLAHEQRLLLRAQAQRLQPVVRLGAAGLSDAVLQEIDRALRAHGLVKVRAAGAQRSERDELSCAMAERLGAARVQVIGSTVILFRPIPESEGKGKAGASAHGRGSAAARAGAGKAEVPAGRDREAARAAAPIRGAKRRNTPQR